MNVVGSILGALVAAKIRLRATSKRPGDERV